MSKWRDAVLLENLFLAKMFHSKRKPNVDEINQKVIDANDSYRSRGVVTHRWKYFIYYEHDPPIEELYDLKRDPQEQTNIAENREYSELVKQLREQTERLYSEAVK